MRVRWLSPIAILLSGCTQVMYSISDGELEQLRQRVHEDLGREFTVDIVDELWVVGSNADEHQTNRAISTLRDYRRGLTQTYFETTPTRAVRVYLFRDKDSYQRYVDRAYSDPPRTPFGFYMPGERKIVLNLSTGTGTLAHELVHPLMEADFALSPPWFNEGFASLFEQSKYLPGGLIEGMVNWRIRTLKRAMGKEVRPSLNQVLNLSRDDFYGANSGVNYALARYLCLYLQQNELLERYYKSFRARRREDPSGLTILSEVCGKPIDRIEADWWAWVSKLPDE